MRLFSICHTVWNSKILTLPQFVILQLAYKHTSPEHACHRAENSLLASQCYL